MNGALFARKNLCMFAGLRARNCQRLVWRTHTRNNTSVSATRTNTNAPDPPLSSSELRIRGPRTSLRSLRTLNTTLLTPEQYTDISNHKSAVFHSRHGNIELFISTMKPFPPNTRGFLYYHKPSFPAPPIAGEVRFRVTTSSDPSSFCSGTDLLANGSTWCINLRQIATYERYIPLRHVLLDDALSTDTIRAAEEAAALVPDSSSLLYYLNQEFVVRFERLFQTIWVWTAKGSGKGLIHGIQRDYRTSERGIPLYTGSAVVRFERSPSSHPSHGRTVALRIVKILKPVQCAVPGYEGPVPPPKEGDFVRRRMHRDVATSIMHWDIDRPANKALKILWKADEDIALHSVPPV